MDNLLVKLFQSPKTVLTNKDIALIWRETDKDKLKSKISYYVKKRDLIRLSRGILAKDKDYNPKELATGIYTPSYISFETVLREEGIIFQHYDSIFIAGPRSKNVSIDEYKFVFRKLKNSVLFNPAGIINQNNYSIASAERAFLDTIHLFPDYYFDNLNSINWDKCFELAQIYKNKQLVRRLTGYFKNYAK